MFLKFKSTASSRKRQRDEKFKIQGQYKMNSEKSRRLRYLGQPYVDSRSTLTQKVQRTSAFGNEKRSKAYVGRLEVTENRSDKRRATLAILSETLSFVLKFSKLKSPEEGRGIKSRNPARLMLHFSPDSEKAINSATASICSKSRVFVRACVFDTS